MTPRVVFDCMIFLQGAGTPASPAAACLHLVDEGWATLCVSDKILMEVRDVLARPTVRRRFPALSPEWAESFVKNIQVKALLFSKVPHAESLARDPKDERYLNLAIAVGANFLVSRDRDFLDVMKDPGFRQRHPALLILEPSAFLQEFAPKMQHDEGFAE